MVSVLLHLLGRGTYTKTIGGAAVTSAAVVSLVLGTAVLDRGRTVVLVSVTFTAIRSEASCFNFRPRGLPKFVLTSFATVQHSVAFQIVVSRESRLLATTSITAVTLSLLVSAGRYSGEQLT